jgi:hypothetical protein
MFTGNISVCVTNRTGDCITVTLILKQAVSQNVKMFSYVGKMFSEDTGIQGI